MKSFESANADEPMEVILATQRAMIASLRSMFRKMKNDMPCDGLTWTQLDFLLDEVSKTKPTVIETEIDD